MPQKELIKTKHIKDALTRYASDNLIPLSECDFHIEEVDTLVKHNKNHDFERYMPKQLKYYLDPQIVINEHVEFSQIYTITAMQKETHKKINLRYSIEFGKYATNPKLILSPQSLIPYKEYKPNELLKLLYLEINKIKAFHGIIIKIFDKTMKKALKIFIKYIYLKKFTKKIKIPIFDGIEPIISRESKIIFWFKKKENNSMIIEVDKNELLIEYRKPLYGRNGFNAYGKIIDDIFSNKSETLKINIDPKSIQIQEDKNTKRYLSKVKGYVHYDNEYLSVDNRLRLREISRYKHIIESYDENNNIDIVITQHDTSKDSIGEGATLTSESIHVEGFVGANSKLEAIHLDIKGATHQDSIQYAKFAKINRHKGTLRCHEANIKLLEGGIVHATTVNIENSLGGFVYAQDVTIKQVKSNLKIYATNSITIDLVSGEDNLFEINYEKVPVILSKIEYLQKEIEELRYKKKQAERFHPDEVDRLKQKIQDYKTQIQKIKESYKYATISVKHPFRGLNTIIYTIDKEHRLIFKTDNKHYETFHIEIKDDLVILQPPALSLSLSDQNKE